MHIDEVIKIMEGIADPGLAAKWDNQGIQVKTGKTEIGSVLVALEISKVVIAEAVEKRADMIITHHPLIFEPVNSIDANNVTGNHIVGLIEAGISVYSAHTNFDEAPGGNNDHIAALLKLENIMAFGGEAFGRFGEFKDEMSIEEVCSVVKESLSLKQVTAVGDPEARIKRVGLCAGAGSDMIDRAFALGCHLFITGDVRYHDARKASECGLCLLDAGHFGTEKFFVDNFAARLKAASEGKIRVLVSEVNLDPFIIR